MPRNDVFGWTWILAGLLAGTALGLRFQREDWLGGYASHPRRLLRLGHIAFLGTGFLNLLFSLALPRLALPGGALAIASWAMIAGAITMPAGCAVLAAKRTWPAPVVFTLPVASLLLGAALVVIGVMR